MFDVVHIADWPFVVCMTMECGVMGYKQHVRCGMGQFSGSSRCLKREEERES